MISAHGGTLVNRMAPESKRDALLAEAATLPAIELNRRETADLLLIANGAFSPLEGFMSQADYDGVLDKMRLGSGVLWSLPVTLSLKTDELSGRPTPFDAALQSADGDLIGIMNVTDVYKVDPTREAELSLGTTDDAHPGVQYLATVSNTYAGGPVTLITPPSQGEFESHHYSPAGTREMFASREWKTVCAFQTRNPIHRAHEYLQKCALEMVDGLLIHPIMGETKSDDIPADVRMDCYLALMENYFPTDHVALSILPAAMRYAGPREAIFHAIMRQNYGCTHIIIGRDHAGVGNYYGTYDAQKIFGTLEPGDLEIQPVFFEHSFFCKQCGNMASQKTCPHDKTHHVFLSGTKVREMLANGEEIPVEFTRREVADILQRFYAGAAKGS